jgi:hypothetical protein
MTGGAGGTTDLQQAVAMEQQKLQFMSQVTVLFPFICLVGHSYFLSLALWDSPFPFTSLVGQSYFLSLALWVCRGFTAFTLLFKLSFNNRILR